MFNEIKWFRTFAKYTTQIYKKATFHFMWVDINSIESIWY